MTDRDCVHGQLARVCDYCELEAEIADLRAQLEQAKAERDEARRNYQWMVERAADQKLDGYRELGARAANAENALDEAEATIARQRAWIEKAGHRRKCSVRAPHAATMDYKPTCDCGWAELVGAALNTKE